MALSMINIELHDVYYFSVFSNDSDVDEILRRNSSL